MILVLSLRTLRIFIQPQSITAYLLTRYFLFFFSLSCVPSVPLFPEEPLPATFNDIRDIKFLIS